MLHEVLRCGEEYEPVPEFEILPTSRLGPSFRDHMHLIAPGCRLIGEQVDLCRPPIDALAVDREGNVVVLDLQIPNAPLELRALHWAEIARGLSLDRALALHSEHQRRLPRPCKDPDAALLRHLDDPDPAAFGRKVRIVLLGLGLPTALHSSLLLLRDQGLDIAFVRVQSFLVDERRIFLHIEQLIPWEETWTQPPPVQLPEGLLFDPPSALNPLMPPER